MADSITIATANTYEARMLREPDGLKPFTDLGVDSILMQEVLGMQVGEVEDRLFQDDYRLAHFDRPSGLAIAVSLDSPFQAVPGSEYSGVIQLPEKIGEFIRSRGFDLGDRLRQRGLIAIKLASIPETEDSEEETTPNVVTLANGHPIIFARWLARRRQVEEIGLQLQLPYFAVDPLILGADMNHYPGPQAVDLALREAARLESVTDEPTWRVHGSKHQWAAEIGSRLLGKPLESFNGSLDVLLFRKLQVESTAIIDISSDHDAIVSKFTFLGTRFQ